MQSLFGPKVYPKVGETQSLPKVGERSQLPFHRHKIGSPRSAYAARAISIAFLLLFHLRRRVS